MMAISFRHKEGGYESPTRSQQVKNVWGGIRRELGVAQVGKQPLRTEHLRKMIRIAPDNLLGIRDKALLLIGFAGAFRRSELIALQISDFVFSVEGIKITLKKSKTDQEGIGRLIGIPYGSHIETCPVRTLQAWIAQGQITSGYLFRGVNKSGKITDGTKPLNDKTVARIIKKYTEAIGLDATKYSGHSLRAGLATTAAEGGASERAIMQQTGHKSVTMVRRYIRDGNIFVENAAAYTGL